ncbi:MAG: cytidine deaminase [Myxococcales bacterium]|nr:cytidine deaminase [Myxococcales bacterium]
MSPTAEQRAALLAAATDARKRAYAPYSHFPVGAAVLTRSGVIYSGCNVESASYPLVCCAERVAIYKAVSDGHLEIVCVVVITDTSPPAAPCGGCRQVIHEFGADAHVVCFNPAGDARETSMATLLPLGFGGASLPATR